LELGLDFRITFAQPGKCFASGTPIHQRNTLPALHHHNERVSRRALHV
jgi:hypothetical protein